MVTAKFKVSRCSPMGDPDNPWAHEVEMTPDYSEGKNKEWAEATPAGVVRLTVKNDLATAQLPVGKAVEIHFIPED